MDMSLSRMLSAGPEVSLNGSPTVSPTTAAAVLVGPLAAEMTGFDVLLGIVPGAAGVRHHNGEEKTGGDGADQEGRRAPQDRE